jgi:ribosomal protein S18 acetylase RimI-like enzyme
MDIGLRPANQHDEPFLREMLYEAVFVPPGSPAPPRRVVDRSDLSRYVQGFGTRRGDLGWIAERSSGDLLGAAWVRQLSGEEPGYGYVDDDTLELSVAVARRRRGRGVGTALLARLLESVPRCSLSVDDRNPAVRLYARFGFEVVSVKEHSLTMLRG